MVAENAERQIMADNVKALTKALGFMAEFNKTAKVLKGNELPPAVTAAFKSVEADENIPVDDPDTSVGYFQIMLEGTGLSDVFIADYSGDDPDMFRIIAAVQDGSVIGTSTEVAS
jgi:hypothetical protein